LDFCLLAIFLLRLNHLVQEQLEMIALSYHEALEELTQSEHLDAVSPRLVVVLGEVLRPLVQLKARAQFHH
jgi:hypothetical protein